ncbi:MAG TPA: hypothetical protein VMS08_05565 [Candidatus Saccharimonadia bacterium]|nr:hypothetical protein [Candidatus Saccharimonadia bacterium]
MVLYKDKSVPLAAAKDMSDALGAITREMLGESYEVRVIEPLAAYNANEVHIEIRFRDFGTWTDELLADYHARVMKQIKAVFTRHQLKGQFSVYLLPSQPPRSIWSQDTV